MPSYSFPKSSRLLSKGQFKYISLSSNRVARKYIVIQWLNNNLGVSRLGIAASKKFGKSYQRNRFKRMVREVFRLLQYSLPQGVDFLIKPRSEAHTATFHEIFTELEDLCEHCFQKER